MMDEHAPNTEVYAIGDRVAVADDESVHLTGGRHVIPVGGRGTVVDLDTRYTELHLVLTFDGIPHKHTIPAFRFRKLDPIESLAELA